MRSTFGKSIQKAGTGNSISTLHYDILEQNNCFSGAKMDVGVGFTLLRDSDNLREIRIYLTFSQNFVSCF